MSVSFNKILAGQRTINVFVSAGAISIAACTVSGNVGGGHVSNPPTFLIIARDGFGNRITTGGETFSISVRAVGDTEAIWTSESAGQPVDGSDGSYSVTYSITRRGAYSVAITSGSTSITGSPMAVTFVDDSDTSALAPVAARSYPSGNGLYSAVVNMPSSFDLRLANIQNIYMWSGSFKANVFFVHDFISWWLHSIHNFIRRSRAGLSLPRRCKSIDHCFRDDPSKQQRGCIWISR